MKETNSMTETTEVFVIGPEHIEETTAAANDGDVRARAVIGIIRGWQARHRDGETFNCIGCDADIGAAHSFLVMLPLATPTLAATSGMPAAVSGICAACAMQVTKEWVVRWVRKTCDAEPIKETH
jgi:hypothetical protein